MGCVNITLVPWKITALDENPEALLTGIKVSILWISSINTGKISYELEYMPATIY